MELVRHFPQRISFDWISRCLCYNLQSWFFPQSLPKATLHHIGLSRCRLKPTLLKMSQLQLEIFDSTFESTQAGSTCHFQCENWLFVKWQFQRRKNLTGNLFLFLSSSSNVHLNLFFSIQNYQAIFCSFIDNIYCLIHTTDILNVLGKILDSLVDISKGKTCEANVQFESNL